MQCRGLSSEKNWLVLEFAWCMTTVEKVKQFKEHDRKFQIIFIGYVQCQTSLKGHSLKLSLNPLSLSEHTELCH